jgi:hypothetical protein
MTIVPCPFQSSFPLRPRLFFSLRSARANTHALIFFFSRSHLSRINTAGAIPPIFFCLSRIGNTFPKRVLIRKKPVRLYTVRTRVRLYSLVLRCTPYPWSAKLSTSLGWDKYIHLVGW